MIIDYSGNEVELKKHASDRERAVVRELLAPLPIKDAPKGMFSLETRARFKTN